MIYAVCSGIVLFVLLEYSGQFLLARMSHVPWGMYRFDLWYYVNNLCFVAAMLSVAAAYRFRAAVFCWDGAVTSATASWIKSIPLGLLGGSVALVVASPTFWLGWGHTRLASIQSLIADAFSSFAVLNLLFFIFALAVSSEIVFRGIILRTFAGYASIPAAALASSLLFAYIFPVLGFGAGIILGITSSILYYKTKNLLAPIFANALFTVGGSGIALYHRLM
jgi:membrane protease YdiL (CAAX protease family)